MGPEFEFIEEAVFVIRDFAPEIRREHHRLGRLICMKEILDESRGRDQTLIVSGVLELSGKFISRINETTVV